MNRKIASALFLIAAAAGTQALAETPTLEQPFVSSASRAAVQAELQAYRQAGVNPWSISYNPLRQFRGTLTREQGVAGYLAGRDQVAAFNGEDSGSTYLAKAGTAPTTASASLAGNSRTLR